MFLKVKHFVQAPVISLLRHLSISPRWELHGGRVENQTLPTQPAFSSPTSPSCLSPARGTPSSTTITRPAPPGSLEGFLHVKHRSCSTKRPLLGRLLMGTWDNWHLLLQHAAQPQQWKIFAFYGHPRLPLAGGQHRRLGLLLPPPAWCGAVPQSTWMGCSHAAFPRRGNVGLNRWHSSFLNKCTRVYFAVRGAGEQI